MAEKGGGVSVVTALERPLCPMLSQFGIGKPPSPQSVDISPTAACWTAESGSCAGDRGGAGCQAAAVIRPMSVRDERALRIRGCGGCHWPNVGAAAAGWISPASLRKSGVTSCQVQRAGQGDQAALAMCVPSSRRNGKPSGQAPERRHMARRLRPPIRSMSARSLFHQKKGGAFSLWSVLSKPCLPVARRFH